MITIIKYKKILAFGFILFYVASKSGAEKNVYSIYWQVPTFQCHKYGYNFSNLPDYGIIQNNADKFNGERIAILYDPGNYPAIINGKDRNGGLPQQGDLHKHLTMFKKDLVKVIPDPNFKGIAIIDFEHWRPIFRQNWASLDIYRNRSRILESKKYPFLSRNEIEKKAAHTFEKSAFAFMDETLALAIEMRPKAKWGYYAFPYCFNYSPKNFQKECSKNVKVDNERSTWMYKTGSAMYPSVYLQQKILNEDKRSKLIEYRILEGKRIQKLSNKNLLLLAYTYYKYTDTGAFLSQGDMKSSILMPKKAGADGIIIWGSSNDVNTKKKCTQLYDYVEKVIRPILKSLMLSKNQFSEEENLYPNEIWDLVKN